MLPAPTDSSSNHQAPNPEQNRGKAKRRKGALAKHTVLHVRLDRLHKRILRDNTAATAATAMEVASSSAPTTSYYNVSVAQAVLTLSINAIVIGLTAIFKSSKSSSSARRRDAAPAPTATAPPPSPSSPAKPVAAAVDMDVVLALMGGAGEVSVGFEDVAALFEEEEATVEEAREAFGVFDRNGDGFIDAAELRSVLASLGLESSSGADADAECQRMIDAYDEDKDGRIDFHEFVKLMEATH